MKTLNQIVSTKSDLPECWLYENGKYQLCNCPRHSLYSVPTQYEMILKSSNIPYRLVTTEDAEYLEYWNPSLYEEIPLSLPLYAKVFNQYRYLGKNYTSSVPTEETIKESYSTSNHLKTKMLEYDDTINETNTYEQIKALLDGSICKVVTCITIDGGDSMDINVNNDHFRIYSHKFFCIIFDLNKIKKNSFITISAPKSISRFVIGANGKNVNRWTKELGVHKINVVSYDD